MLWSQRAGSRAAPGVEPAACPGAICGPGLGTRAARVSVRAEPAACTQGTRAVTSRPSTRPPWGRAEVTGARVRARPVHQGPGSVPLVQGEGAVGAGSAALPTSGRGRWILRGGSFWVHGTCSPSAEPLLTLVEASRARPLRTFMLPATCTPRCSENPWPPSPCLPVPLTVILHPAARRAMTTPPARGPLCSAPPVLPSHPGGTDPLVPHLAHGLSDLISRPPPPPASQLPSLLLQPLSLLLGLSAFSSSFPASQCPMEANTSGVLLHRGTTPAQPFSGAFLAPTATGLLHFLGPLLQSVPAAPVADGTSLHSTPRVGFLFLHQSVLATSRAVSSVSICPHTRTRTGTPPTRM